MIIIDANLLIYSKMSGMEQHQKAREWFEKVLNGKTRVGLPWVSILAFIRLTTNRRVFEKPMSILEAWCTVCEWLDVPCVWIPEPTEVHKEILGKLITRIGGHSNLVPDAHLAALALEHGLILSTTDNDFARFEGLKWVNPLV